MNVSSNKQVKFFRIAPAMYLSFVSERFKRCFLISNDFTANINFVRANILPPELRAERVYIRLNFGLGIIGSLRYKSEGRGFDPRWSH